MLRIGLMRILICDFDIGCAVFFCMDIPPCILAFSLFLNGREFFTGCISMCDVKDLILTRFTIRIICILPELVDELIYRECITTQYVHMLHREVIILKSFPDFTPVILCTQNFISSFEL